MWPNAITSKIVIKTKTNCLQELIEKAEDVASVQLRLCPNIQYDSKLKNKNKNCLQELIENAEDSGARSVKVVTQCSIQYDSNKNQNKLFAGAD